MMVGLGMGGSLLCRGAREEGGEEEEWQWPAAARYEGCEEGWWRGAREARRNGVGQGADG